MRTRTPLALAAALALGAPAAASADIFSLSLTVWGGRQYSNVLTAKQDLASFSSKDVIDGRFNTWGTQALARIAMFDAGLLFEGGFPGSGPKSGVVTPVFGVNWSFPIIKLDLLGEFGGHRVTNIGQSDQFTAASTQTTWLPQAGLRFGVSLRAPMGPVGLVLTVTPYARWDLVRKTVTVPGAGADAGTFRAYSVGGSTYGVIGGIGIEI